MGKGFQGAMLRAMRVEEHTATVIESEWLTQHVVHITFHSDTLLNSDGELPASWVRVWFPDHEGQGKLHQRCYTLLHADPTTGVPTTNRRAATCLSATQHRGPQSTPSSARCPPAARPSRF